MEVYGRKKRGVAYNHQGQRVGRPHVATWAETEAVLAADLGDGTDDPRASAPDLLRRALAALPRAGAGFGAGGDARRCRVLRRRSWPAPPTTRISAFAIGAKRIAPLWRLLAGIADEDWHDAIDMGNAQVAVAEYCPDWWPTNTALLVRRVLLDPEQVSADPRSRRRRTLHPDQRALPIPELAGAAAIYAYSFIVTNLDVSSPDKAVAAEHWYRHRTTVENIFRDSKLGAALRHLPSGYPQVNLAWMWGALLAATMAAWLHQLTALTAGEGHPVRARRARRQGHDRHPALAADRRPRPADPPCPPPDPAAAARPQPAPRDPGPAAGPAHRRLTCPPEPSAPRPCPRPARARAAERPADREPGASPGLSACPPPGSRAHQDHLPGSGVSSPRYSRNRGKRRDKPAWRRR